MTLAPAEILLAAAEVAERLAHRPVQKVVQRGEHTVLLGFPGEWLLLSIDRRSGRLHLTGEKPAGTGEAASSFCMLLRKELGGLWLSSIEPVLGERALAIEFEREDRKRRLYLFLYGAGARLVLSDGEGRPMGALPQAPPSTEPVVLPPPRSTDVAPAPRFHRPEVSAQIAAHYAERETRDAVEAARTSALSSAKKHVDRIERRLTALTRDLERIAATADHKRDADLLLAHRSEVPRGASEVVLADDYNEGAPRRIQLDPTRSATDNAARLYHAHKRMQRGRIAVDQRIAETRAELATAEQTLEAIRVADDATLPGLTLGHARQVGQLGGPGRGRAPSSGGKDKVGEARSPRLPYRAYRSASGAQILVGKGADKNDALTFHVARGNDLWLHTRDFPGAHVVVLLAGRPIDEQTLLDAATLALWFSPARPEEGLVPGAADRRPHPHPMNDPVSAVTADITYALRKLVRKPRGAAPGRVSVSGGKTIRVRLERARITRLLESVD